MNFKLPTSHFTPHKPKKMSNDAHMMSLKHAKLVEEARKQHRSAFTPVRSTTPSSSKVPSVPVTPRELPPARSLHQFNNALSIMNSHELVAWLGGLSFSGAKEMREFISECRNNHLSGMTACKWTDGVLESAYCLRDQSLRRNILRARDLKAGMLHPSQVPSHNKVSPAIAIPYVPVIPSVVSTKIAMGPPEPRQPVTLPSLVPFTEVKRESPLYDESDEDDEDKDVELPSLVAKVPEPGQVFTFNSYLDMYHLDYDSNTLVKECHVESNVPMMTTVEQFAWFVFARMGTQEEFVLTRVKCPFRLGLKAWNGDGTTFRKGTRLLDLSPEMLKDLIIERFVWY